MGEDGIVKFLRRLLRDWMEIVEMSFANFLRRIDEAVAARQLGEYADGTDVEPVVYDTRRKGD